MEKTPLGTSVGVDDPYAFVDQCDHVTHDGRCRFAVEHAERDDSFAAARRADDLRCPAADPDGAWEWADCPHLQARQQARECVRCGLEEQRVAHSCDRPLLEEHHLVYPGNDASHQDLKPTNGEQITPSDGRSHEITIYLCRWCHAKIHRSWARVDDDVAPDPEAIAVAESRRSKELEEASFQTAAERFE